MLSSFPAARMLVKALHFTGLTSKSCSRECSPIIIPGYTFVPGVINSFPLGSMAERAYAVASPLQKKERIKIQ